MKKIITMILLVAVFFACTKEKKLPAEQQTINATDNENAISGSTVKQLSDTSNKQNPLYFKKKAVKIKYPRPKSVN